MVMMDYKTGDSMGSRKFYGVDSYALKTFELLLEVKRKKSAKTETEQDPVGLLGMEAFLVCRE